MKQKKKTLQKENGFLKRIGLLAAGICLMSLPLTARAENPLVQTAYLTDPSPFVVKDENGEETIYVLTGHDEQRELNQGLDFTGGVSMRDWRLISSKDMVNWTDHGAVFDCKGHDGNSNYRAWASQCIMRPMKQEDGTWKDQYFLYTCFNGTKIDVAVADNPWGPFQDATPGKYLIDGGWGGGNIDPTVFIDDNGYPDDPDEWDAYLYWGNPYLRYCKLTDDMLDVDPDTDGDGELSEWESKQDPRFSNEDNRIFGQSRPGIHSFQTYGAEGRQAFGIPTVNPGSTGKFPLDPAGSEQPRSAFEEGPWLWKHEDDDPYTDDYFLVYPGGRTQGETLEYSTAPGPLGPWTWQGLLMEREHGFSSNHPGVATFKGRHYLFYHTEMLVGSTSNNRSVSVIEFEYDENNLIKRQTSPSTRALFSMGITNAAKGTAYFSVDPADTLDPYTLSQAETICWESNLTSIQGGYRGTGSGIRTKPKSQYTGVDPATGKVAFWQSSARYGSVVSHIHNNDYIKVANVDFGLRGASAFTATVACAMDANTIGGEIELWIDYNDVSKREQIGILQVENTGAGDVYQDITTNITENVTGIHELFFVFKGEEITPPTGYSTQNYGTAGVIEDDLLSHGLFEFDTWQFTETVVKVSGITLNGTSKSLKLGESFTIQPIVMPEYATNKEVEYASSDSKIVEINGNVITAKSSGTATITVTAKDGSGIKASLAVTVEATKVSGITLNTANKTLKIGDNFTITVNVIPKDATNNNITFTSSNSKVAEVNGYVVTAKAAGTATITATAQDGSGVKATLVINVQADRPGAPQSVKANQISAAAIKITWAKVAKAKQYTIYRSMKSKTGFKKLKTVSANSFHDKSVKPGKTYYYYITAAGVKEADISQPSNTVNASTLKAPSVSLKSKTENQVKVSWKKIKGASGYQVFISTKESSGFKRTATLKKAGKISVDIGKLSKDKIYYIKARAYKSVNGKKVYGAFSKVKNIQILNWL